MATIKNFRTQRSEIEKIRQEINAALKGVADKYDISIVTGNASYNDDMVQFKLICATKNDSEVGLDANGLDAKENEQFVQLLKSKLIELNVSVRLLNSIKSCRIETLGDVVSYQKTDFLKLKNFGKKALRELENLIESKGLAFGMNISKYGIEPHKTIHTSI